MQVVALGQMSVYAARADLQLVVKALDAQGDGLWRKALERTRAALAADGLLDPARRRPLPRFPRRVAVVTSPDGAALHDIVAVTAGGGRPQSSSSSRPRCRVMAPRPSCARRSRAPAGGATATAAASTW
jgi:hypothetical protein